MISRPTFSNIEKFVNFKTFLADLQSIHLLKDGCLFIFQIKLLSGSHSGSYYKKRKTGANSDQSDLTASKQEVKGDKH